jgi:hypothetical protein
MRAVMDRAEQLIETNASPATAVSELVVAAAGRRGALEGARDVFIDRLHRASDDYFATNALRLVYSAINALDAENTAEHVPARPARRWSQRSRALRRLDARRHDRDGRVASSAAAAANARTGASEQPERREMTPIDQFRRADDTDPWALDRAADDGWPDSNAFPTPSTADSEAELVLAGRGGDQSTV